MQAEARGTRSQQCTSCSQGTEDVETETVLSENLDPREGCRGRWLTHLATFYS